MNTYKYADAENTAVNVTGEYTGTVPEGHRFWQEWGIADAIKEGKVEAFITQEEIEKQESDKLVAEAKAYLANTDFKMTSDYDEVVPEIIYKKRKEARELIRAQAKIY